jgi:Uma2 family endonuclease
LRDDAEHPSCAVRRPPTTRRHNALCGRLHDAIRAALGDGPRVLERSDQRVAVLTRDRGWVVHHPDLAVYATDDAHPADPEARVNPVLLVEVTGDDTEDEDRTAKLQDYLQVGALEEYVIVAHARPELEVWRRTPAGWTRIVVRDGVLRLRCGALIDVEALYRGG